MNDNLKDKVCENIMDFFEEHFRGENRKKFFDLCLIVSRTFDTHEKLMALKARHGGLKLIHPLNPP